MIAKECWLKKNSTAVKWSRLTLVSLKWCSAERGSLIFVAPQAPRFIVMCLSVAKRTFCVWAHEKSKKPISGRRRCAFMNWWMGLEYPNRTSSWLTVTNGGATPFHSFFFFYKSLLSSKKKKKPNICYFQLLRHKKCSCSTFYIIILNLTASTVGTNQLIWRQLGPQKVVEESVFGKFQLIDR